LTAYIESFSSRSEDRLLNGESSANLPEAKVLVEDHHLQYNHSQPHGPLHYMMSVVFAVACLAAASGGPAPMPNREEDAVSSLIRTGT